MTLPPFEHPHPEFGPNVGTSLEALKGLLDALGAGRVFLVTGKHAYEAVPAETSADVRTETTGTTYKASSKAAIASRMKTILEGRTYYRHWDFGVNPQLDDLMRGAEAFRRFQPDVLVAIGGGSVMDTAKLLPLLPADLKGATAILKGTDTELKRTIPFIAIPTTAGSGSEATQFSVVYIGMEKCTVDHPVVLPDSVILDPSLTENVPAYLAATTGMDALSQAIESYWSKGATAESQAYAVQAINTILRAFPEVVRTPTEANRKRMLEGSYLAGKAINISRTTAPHAVSYRLAQLYKIPHGHAVALTLPTFFAYNLEAEESCINQAQRVNTATMITGTETSPTIPAVGTAAGTERMAVKLCNLLGCSTVQEGKARLEHLMDEAGLKRSLTALGATSRADLDDLVASVNQHRLSNNPRPVDAATLHRLLEALW